MLFTYQELQETLAEVRRHRQPFETPREYGLRIASDAPQEWAEEPASDARLKQLHAMVYDALYGARECTAEDARRAQELARQLRNTL